MQKANILISLRDNATNFISVNKMHEVSSWKERSTFIFYQLPSRFRYKNTKEGACSPRVISRFMNVHA